MLCQITAAPVSCPIPPCRFDLASIIDYKVRVMLRLPPTEEGGQPGTQFVKEVTVASKVSGSGPFTSAVPLPADLEPKAYSLEFYGAFELSSVQLGTLASGIIPGSSRIGELRGIKLCDFATEVP